MLGEVRDLHVVVAAAIAACLLPEDLRARAKFDSDLNKILDTHRMLISAEK